MRRYPVEQVEQGNVRFLDLFRTTQALDAASELVEPCRHGCGYPAAINGECFTCQSRGLVS